MDIGQKSSIFSITGKTEFGPRPKSIRQSNKRKVWTFAEDDGYDYDYYYKADRIYIEANYIFSPVVQNFEYILAV